MDYYGNHYDDILFETAEALVAVSELGKFVVCDPPVCDELVPPSFFHGKKVYLVSTHVDVFMLVSFSGTSYYFGHETYDDELKRFEVYRYDEGKWCSTQNLNEFTIFLGHNHSLAVRNAPGFRANCIYFTDDDEGKVENSGVFSLEDGEAERMQWLMPAGSTKKCETINLELVSQHHHNITKHSRLFLNVSTNQVHRCDLPENSHQKTICGFSADWLILLDDQNSSLTLLNAFTGHQVDNLPQLPRNGTVHKATLSSDPLCNPKGYKVLAIFGEKRNLICY
ncbi:hypothetical protein ACLB2K_052171 [Fragaria x ananassa]